MTDLSLPGVDVRHVPDLIALDAYGHAIVDAVTAAGGRALLVGGCVRDALRDRSVVPKDVDLEVYGLSTAQLVRALARVGYVDEVGRAFAVLKMRHGGIDYDIALPRREVKTGPGHRDFAVVPDPTCDVRTASARRDFTINALLWDPSSGELLDCWDGVGDLSAGVLRHTGPAFVEDPLRVLRAVGFVARFGYRIAPDTVSLCQALADQFSTLSIERVWAEWHKIAAKGVHLAAAVRALADTGWLAHFPELAVLDGLEQDPAWHPEGDVLTHSALAAQEAAQAADDLHLTGDDRAVVVLGALLHDVGKASTTTTVVGPDGDRRITSHGHYTAGVAPAGAFCRRIGTPKAIRDRVVPLVAEHMLATTVANPSAAVVRRLARRLAPATIEEWALVAEADKAGRGVGSTSAGTGPWLQLARTLGAARRPAERMLRGEHLIAAGLRPGPLFSSILSASLCAQDDGQFTDEDGARRWLTGHIAQLTSAAPGSPV